MKPVCKDFDISVDYSGNIVPFNEERGRFHFYFRFDCSGFAVYSCKAVRYIDCYEMYAVEIPSEWAPIHVLNSAKTLAQEYYDTIKHDL